MPGIIPMKVIQVGKGSQSRIAQACDRCRSKKIRCDGLRPTCSQCSSVGFNCKTSDKLSRRAFPRGYTESLEERIRGLESENRGLKDALDEQDKRLEFLSKSRTPANRITPAIPSPPPSSSAASSTNGSTAAPASSQSPIRSSPHSAGTPPTSTLSPEDTFKTPIPSLQLGVENSDSFFMGPSSGKNFIESFKRLMQEKAIHCPSFNSQVFLHMQGCSPLTSEVASNPPNLNSIPPRLFTDKCVNVFFQEWAPLFPVLHKPDFLRTYDEFMTDHSKVKSPHKLAQLYLVFAIAALSSDQTDTDQIAFCERRWQSFLDPLVLDSSISTLQCVILAMMYCTIRGNYKRLQYYRSIAVSACLRLGLHHKQKYFSFGALTVECRKRAFWTLYTVDCFAAALLGSPRLISDSWVETEYPIDADDEYISDAGIQPTLPGEATRISSALALFRISRIMAKILDTAYVSGAADLSVQTMNAFDQQLAKWENSLPPHLKLVFEQDKPSTNMTGSRSPILALALNYIRVLTHRPALEAKPLAGNGANILTIGKASKRIVQIIELLEERRMSFALCLNKADLLAISGLSLLYEGIKLGSHGNISLQGNVPLVNFVVKGLFRLKAPGCLDFKKAAAAFVRLEDGSVLRLQDEPKAMALHRPRSESGSISTARTKVASEGSAGRTATSNSHPLQARLDIASASEPDLVAQAERIRRMTMPTMPSRPNLRTPTMGSFDLGKNSIIPAAPGDAGFDLFYPYGASSNTEVSKHGSQADLEASSLTPSRLSIDGGSSTEEALKTMMSSAMADSAVAEGTNHLFDMIYGNQHDIIMGQESSPSGSSGGHQQLPDGWNYNMHVSVGGGPPSLAISDTTAGSDEQAAAAVAAGGASSAAAAADLETSRMSPPGASPQQKAEFTPLVMNGLGNEDGYSMSFIGDNMLDTFSSFV
ncbi:Transcriptional activator protein acu-15 [Ceratocystis fimbriata CBS 114723]|uniref:Transcriptional activator protein acu-15 n=1 Tax=Ceratocystis fimbriata CBS 114723 TaxID=1035309 RepID=A0A2C5WVH3_9PEZI|nr:Transcriptional activator protein acu-15 [Ceratocystis fimbriata CBS 114723]